MSTTNWRRYVRSRLPRLQTSAEREMEIIEELAAQLEATYARARAGGATHEDALQAAAAEVPDWEALAGALGRIEPPASIRVTPGSRSRLMSGFVQDIRYALRALAHAPGFAAVAIVTLALGIGATTIVYSLVDGILLRPLPITDPDRVILTREFVQGLEDSVSWPNFEDWRKRATSFEGLAAWRGLTANLTGLGEPRRLMSRQVTGNVFRVLGVTPVLGRDFAPDDDKPGVPRVVVVSYGFWQRDLGGTDAALGRTIIVDDVPVTVIGVLPPSFTVARQEDLFLPFGNYLDGSIPMFFGRGNHFGLAGIGRLKPGATVASANAEMVAIARQLEQEHSDTNTGHSAIVRPLFDVLVGSSRPMLWMLLGAVAAMLAIACVNLANLMLARAAGRAQEMAVRRSLGAARWRIASQMLTESLLIAAAGGAAGTLVAFAGFRAVLALLPPDQPRIHIVALDVRVLAITAAVTILTGLAFGMIPALQAARGRGASLLRTARVTSTAHGGVRLRRALLFAEVAMALVLVAGAGLMLRTMQNLLAVDTGFATDRILSASFNLPPRYDMQKRLVFLDSAIERLRAVPGVTNAAFTYSLPVAGSNWNSVFTVEGRPAPARSDLPNAAWTPVSTDYFVTMGMRMVRGRPIENRDTTDTPMVVVVNETFARRLFGDGNPLGARIKQGWPEDKSPWREIVGVVNDVRVAGLVGDTPNQVYAPVAQMGQRSGAFVVRAAGDPRMLGRALESAVHEIDPGLPLFNVRTMGDVVDASIGQQRLTLALLGGFAALALLMAAIGVFGVTSYAVSQRTHELGVRIALGASRGAVLRLVLRQELGVCLAGIGAGLAGALALSSLVAGLLYGVPPRDPATLAAVAATLLVVTALAAYVPARRATRIDPVNALRME